MTGPSLTAQRRAHVKLCRQLGVHADEYAGRMLESVAKAVWMEFLQAFANDPGMGDHERELARKLLGATVPLEGADGTR